MNIAHDHKLSEGEKSPVVRHPLIALFCLILFTSLIVYYPFLFKKEIFMYADIGSDTRNIYYPFFMSLARKIENCDFSMWDFSHGLGANILTRQVDVGNLFTWLTLMFGADDIKYTLVYVHLLKIFLSGFACYFYLNEFRFSELPKVLASYIFAFNGFTMLWGQHYFFGSACLYMVLMLSSIEKSFKARTGYIWVTVITFLVMCNSYYLAYMILLTAAVYTLLRLGWMYTFRDLKIVMRKIMSLFGAVLLGGCMAAFLFLPAVSVLLSTSSRLSNGLSLFEKIKQCFLQPAYDTHTVQIILSRLFSNNLMSIADHTAPEYYYEITQWFFSSFILYFSILFVADTFTNKAEKRKYKIIKLFSFAIVVYLTFHPFLSMVLNGFVAPFYRYTMVLMPILALLFAYVLDKLFHSELSYGKASLGLICILATGILTIVILKTNTGSRASAALGIAYLLLSIFFGVASVLHFDAEKKHFHKWFAISVILVFVLNVTAENILTTTRGRLLASQWNGQVYTTSGNDDVRNALDYIKARDDSFHRTEKTFQDISYLNDSLLQGYYGISVYNSVVNKEIVSFVDLVCPDYGVATNRYCYDFRQVSTQSDLLSLLGVKYILVTHEWDKEMFDKIPEYSYLETFGDVHLYENTKCTGIAQFYTNAVAPEMYLRLKETSDKFILDDTVMIQDLTDHVTGVTHSEATVNFPSPSNSSRVEGQVIADQSGLVFLSIPYENGWKAYVDGVETPIEKADIAFMAIPVSEGEHEILLQYNTPLLKEGIMISGIGLLCFVTMCIIIYKKEKSCEV